MAKVRRVTDQETWTIGTMYKEAARKFDNEAGNAFADGNDLFAHRLRDEAGELRKKGSELMAASSEMHEDSA